MRYKQTPKDFICKCSCISVPRLFYNASHRFFPVKYSSLLIRFGNFFICHNSPHKKCVSPLNIFSFLNESIEILDIQFTIFYSRPRAEGDEIPGDK